MHTSHDLCDLFDFLIFIFTFYVPVVSFKPADLDGAVLGSVTDGEFVKLPSYSALQSQVKRTGKVYTQVCVCHHHVYVCVCICCHLQPLNKGRLSFSVGHVLTESSSFWRQHLRNCLQHLTQQWALWHQAGKPDRDDRGTEYWLIWTIVLLFLKVGCKQMERKGDSLTMTIGETDILPMSVLLERLFRVSRVNLLTAGLQEAGGDIIIIGELKANEWGCNHL